MSNNCKNIVPKNAKIYSLQVQGDASQNTRILYLWKIYIK